MTLPDDAPPAPAPPPAPGASPAPTAALAPTAAADSVAGAAPPPEAGGPAGEVPGYRLGAVLGRGGMGEVAVARDLRLGRDVALKRMRAGAAGAAATARFLREARVQAVLDHPAIVPVHEVGQDAGGQPYFTMKRLAGRTLAEELARSPEAPRQRLLRAFADVCRAVELAHARGVVHRDLKPANIMLGDYGEVYVLDWGVARVLGAAGELGLEDAPGAAGVADATGAPVTPGAPGAATDAAPDATGAGALLGTPGYMAPEQIRSAADVEPPADVYALGAILFELLAQEPLHPRGAAALVATLAGGGEAPGRRRPDRAVPPELDGLCAEALALEPAGRPTARAMASRIEAYLDGDRDVARRRDLALEAVEASSRALAAGERAEATRLAGRALALDPDSRAAAELVSSLLLRPPDEVPPPLARHLEAVEAAHAHGHALASARAFLAYFLFLPGLALFGEVRQWGVVIGTFAAVAGIALVSGRQRLPLAARLGAALTCAMIFLVLMARVTSPFVIVPAIAATIGAALMSYPSLSARPVIPIGALLAAFLLPLALEAVGAWAPTWHGTPRGLVLEPTAVGLHEGGALVVLLIFHAVMLVVVCLHARRVAIGRRDAQRRVEIQAWHLRQLLP